jgi:type IV secretory pathway ATPase VirB11/archaellum biosynthesis ATPase
LDEYTAGLLSFLVQNRAAFLVCGARGAGKSSLLSALMFEFPKSQRILSIEDTMELPGGVSE